MILTAYHRWLYISHEGDRDEIARQLYVDCYSDQNPQAFDLLADTGDKVFTKETFDKAADLILDQYKTKIKEQDDDN